MQGKNLQFGMGEAKASGTMRDLFPTQESLNNLDALVTPIRARKRRRSKYTRSSLILRVFAAFLPLLAGVRAAPQLWERAARRVRRLQSIHQSRMEKELP
jgi:hypothetical protein